MKWRCSHCGKSLITKSGFVINGLSQVGGGPYQCPHCNKWTDRKDALKSVPLHEKKEKQ